MTQHKSNSHFSFLWLRRDLRTHDHAALAVAAKAGRPVQPVFIFDPGILARFKNPQDRRLSFIAAALCRMHAQLKAQGGKLWVFHGKPETIWTSLAQGASVFCNEDYEPSAIARDAAIASIIGRERFQAVKDHLLLSPRENLKVDGSPFKVFTPYYRQWEMRLAEIGVEAMTSAPSWHTGPSPAEAIDPDQGVAAMLARIGYRHAALTDWPVDVAQERLERFAEEKVRTYMTGRNIMGLAGTSRLSPYLRFGLLSVRECARIMQGRPGGDGWLRELAWRDFYAMILFHFPQTVEHAFNEKFQGRIEWKNDPRQFERFVQGQTGYPVVDAAMRELLQTGWMHNRARMITASFLTKDLHIDWRWGEEHFAQWLMDYDQASNVGGWQWAASTGTDAQPWFRVFNPVLQGQKFDPDGEYVRRFVPELAALSAKDIHEPWKQARPKGYPPPIVDHQRARQQALAMYKRAQGGEADASQDSLF